MNNLNEYKKRFNTLMESTIGNVKPLITEQENNDEIIERMFDTLFREGSKASAFVQEKFDILATLLNNELKNPKKEYHDEYFKKGAFNHTVWMMVKPSVITASDPEVRNYDLRSLDSFTFTILNSYLNYLYPKKTSMINTYGGEGKRYPKLNASSFDNVKKLLEDMDLDGDQVFGKHWKNYREYKYNPTSSDQ
jgi:hypothetical protein